MVMTTKERTELRNELVSQGYAWEYVDEWQPKTTLYLHRAKKNQVGEEVIPVGTKISGVPGNPDYVLRKSKIGLFQWPPSDTCECQWCKVRVAEKAKVENKVSKEYRCDIQDCGFDANGKDHAAKSSSLRMHMRNSH